MVSFCDSRYMFRMILYDLPKRSDTALPVEIERFLVNWRTLLAVRL